MTHTTEPQPALQEIVPDTGLPPRTGADLIAQREREGVFLPHEDLPDSPALARHLRERAQRRGS